MEPIKTDALKILSDWKTYNNGLPNNDPNVSRLSKRNLGKSIVNGEIEKAEREIKSMDSKDFCTDATLSKIDNQKKILEKTERENSDIITEKDKGFIKSLKEKMDLIKSECQRLKSEIENVENNGDVVDTENVEDNDNTTEEIDDNGDVAEVDNVDLDYDPNKTYTRTEYINLVKDIAIDQMKRYNIPASITIAQGIIESADRYGVPANSELAKKGKNHFGVKCHDGWSGEKIYLDTEEEDANGNRYTVEGDCFRKYDYIKDSFEDHSKFLANEPRYDSLFDLDITDYKGFPVTIIAIVYHIYEVSATIYIT